VLFLGSVFTGCSAACCQSITVLGGTFDQLRGKPRSSGKNKMLVNNQARRMEKTGGLVVCRFQPDDV
jgi:hypothetical protein